MFAKHPSGAPLSLQSEAELIPVHRPYQSPRGLSKTNFFTLGILLNIVRISSKGLAYNKVHTNSFCLSGK